MTEDQNPCSKKEIEKLDAEIAKLNAETNNLNSQKGRVRFQVWTPAIITAISIAITAIIFFNSQSYDVNKKLLEIQSDSLNLKICHQTDTFNSLKLDALIAKTNLKVYADSLNKSQIYLSELKKTIADTSRNANYYQKQIARYKSESTAMAERFKKRVYTTIDLNTKKEDLLQKINDQESHFQEMASLTTDFIVSVQQEAYRIRTANDTTGLTHTLSVGEDLSKYMRRPFILR